jgi:hypothetical protein
MLDAVFVNMEAAQERLKHLLLLLTAFTSFRVFIPSNDQGWFVSLATPDSGQLDMKPQWGQAAYFVSDHRGVIESFTESTVPRVPDAESRAYFNAYGHPVDQVLVFPNVISELLDAAYEISEDARFALLSACSLLDQGLALWHAHPSLSFASCVSALESLIAFEHKDEKNEVCQSCGQERFRVMKKFQEFFGKYGSPSPEFKRYAQKVYQYRSRILHRGELFLGEVIPHKFGAVDAFADRDLHRNLIRTCRICIVNWAIAKHYAQPVIAPNATR